MKEFSPGLQLTSLQVSMEQNSLTDNLIKSKLGHFLPACYLICCRQLKWQCSRHSCCY